MRRGRDVGRTRPYRLSLLKHDIAYSAYFQYYIHFKALTFQSPVFLCQILNFAMNYTFGTQVLNAENCVQQFPFTRTMFSTTEKAQSEDVMEIVVEASNVCIVNVSAFHLSHILFCSEHQLVIHDPPWQLLKHATCRMNMNCLHQGNTYITWLLPEQVYTIPAGV